MRKIDLISKKFGKLTVIKKAKNKGKYTQWLCQCECGNYKIARTLDLRRGHTKSCGCLKHLQYNFKHGKSDTRLYRIYKHMISRCYNPNNTAYKHYGGRGIKVCNHWKRSLEFFIQWALANGYKDNLTLERINVNGDYTPENCKWIPQSEQLKNTRRTILITYNNETLCLTDWAKKINIHRATLDYRIKKWGVEKAFTTPKFEH